MGLFDNGEPSPTPSAPNLFGTYEDPTRRKYKPKKPVAPKVTAPSVTTPPIPGQSGGDNPSSSKQLPFIWGLGQTALKGLLSSSAAGIAVFEEGVKLGDKPVTQASKNVAALWGPTGVFDPQTWENVKTGESVLRDLGVKEEPVKLKMPGVDIPLPFLGTNLFWQGLGLDIATDPLTYTPLTILSTPTKAIAAAARAGIKAGKLATASEVAAKLAADKAGKSIEIFNERNMGISKKLNKQSVQSVRNSILRTDPEAAKVITKAEQKIANNTYKTVRVAEGRTLSQGAQEVVASAVEAAVKAASNSYVSVTTARFLQKYAKRDIKGIFTRKLVTNVTRNSDGTYSVLSGNKVKLGEATTKEAAEILAKNIQRGAEPATKIAPVTAVSGARVAAKETAEGAESVVLPSVAGDEVSLEAMVPHQADNGKVYVYDGDNVAEFENLSDATQWIEVMSSPAAKQELDPIIAGKSGAYTVTVGETVTRFKTKREATAYANAVKTGEIAIEPRLTRGGTPLVDIAPPAIPAKEILKIPSKKEVSALKKVLAGIDDIAKKTSGFKPAVGRATANQISQILSKTQEQLDKLLFSLSDGIVSTLRAFVAQDMTYKEFAASLEAAGASGKQLLAVIRTLPIETSAGKVEFGTLIDKAKGNFQNLSKANEGIDATGLEKQVLYQIKTRFYERAQLLKSKQVEPTTTALGKYQAIRAVAGEEIADLIKGTGYLDNPTKETTAKVKEILKSIVSGSTEVNYQSADDLIEGLRRGDEVSADALEEIVNLIDPEGGIKAKVVQAAAEPDAAYFTRLLTREGGVHTIEEAERRLAMAGDMDMLLKHSNLSYQSEVVALAKAMQDPAKREGVAGIEFRSTKQAYAESFSQYSSATQRDAMDSVSRAIMGVQEKGGTRGRQAFKATILEQATGEVRTSTLSDEIAITGEAYADKSRAMFTRSLQQSDEVRIIGSLLGKANSRKVPRGQKRLDWLITHLSAARDGLGGMGFRFVRAKNRNDVKFQQAYQASIEAARETASTPNFSAMAHKHQVYLPMADILHLFKGTKAEQALLDGFFPTGRANMQQDVMSWYSLGEAARRVLEVDSAGEVFDVNEIVMRLIRNDPTKLPSKRRIEIFEKAANEIAEFLTDPETVVRLKAIHLDNAGAIVKDFAQKAEDYSADLFNIVDKAWITMHATDNISEAARVDAVRLWFRKFVLASDIMRLEGGPIAEAMFRASAMLFAEGGKILPESKISKALTESQKEFYNLLRAEELASFREALVRYYRHADIPTAPLGREGMPAPKKKAQNDAQAALDLIMEEYAKHMDDLSRVEATGEIDLIKTWEKKMKSLQTRLNKARENAWNKWLPTYHWHPIEGWVRTENFNHDAALAAARQAHSKYLAAKQGTAARELLMADTTPVVPPHRQLSPKEKAKFLEKHRKEATNKLIENATSVMDDVAKNVADEVGIGSLDNLDLNGSNVMMIAAQNMAARGTKELTEIRTYVANGNYKDALPASDAEFNRTFRPLLNEETPVTDFDRLVAKTKMLAERWSATTRGQADVLDVLRTQENKATERVANFTSTVDNLVRSMRGLNVDDIDDIWTSIRDDIPFSADEAANKVKARDNLAKLVNDSLKDEITSVLTVNRIDGRELAKVFKRYGLDEKIGFPSADALDAKTPEELVEMLIKELPFGANPMKAGTGEAIEWAAKKNTFRSTNLPAATVFARMFSAISHVKTEQGIAHGLVAQFGWKAQPEFRTMQDAINAGWVEIVSSDGKQSIARFLPDAENGNLFHPMVAEGMGRVFREWNAIYEKNPVPQWLRSSMRFMGFLKFTQTTARLGHHFVNLIGDATNMIMFAGIENYARMGEIAYDGADLSNRYTRANFRADYSQLGKDFEAQVARIQEAWADAPGAKVPRGKPEPEIALPFYDEKGKPSVRRFDREQFSKDLGERGVFVPGFVTSDIMNSTNDIMFTGATAGQKRAMARIWSKVARPGHEVMKGLSTATASYSNIIRGMTAMRVAKSRPWGSYEEMMNAIVREVNLIHPTVQSLASSEKKYGRLLVTYYTWLRQAHNALWDAAVNHTGAVLAIPKAQYNYAVAQGFDPQSPAVPFENQNVLPDYISYSVYGPTQMGPQGPRMIRPPLMLLDVLDFWKVYYDPSKPPDANALQAWQDLMGEVIGPSLNILGQPILQSAAGNYGGAKTGGQFFDAAASNLGVYNLLVGLNMHTPYRYQNPDTTNPLTDADRKRILDNWLWGSRAQDIYRPINLKLGLSQYGSRLKDYAEAETQKEINKLNKYVEDRLEEGYSREQIIDMLKQMGVK